MITLKTTDLLAALEFVAPFSDGDKTLPILGCVLIECGDVIRFTATDLECAGSFTTGEFSADGLTGRMAVPASRLVRYVRTIQSPDVRLDLDGRDLLIAHGDYGKATICGLDAETFPEIPQPTGVDIALTGLRSLLPRAVIAISEEESRFTLNGALLEFAGDGGKLVSTDGHRLGIQTLGAKWPDAVFTQRLMLPLRGMKHLIRAEVDAAEMQSDSAHVFFSLDGHREVTMRQMTGKFPDYMRVMKELPHPGTLDAAALLGALRSVWQLSDSLSRSVTFMLHPGALELRAEASERGKAADLIAVDYAGPEITFGMNGNYLKQFLELASGPVTIRAKDAWTMFQFEVEGWVMAVMPMKI